MGYLCYKASGGNVSLSGSKYTGLEAYGTNHLCLRTGTGNGDIIRYGLTTNTSVTGLKLSISGKKVGIAERYTTSTSYATTTSVSSHVSTSQQSVSQYSSSKPVRSGASTLRSLGATTVITAEDHTPWTVVWSSSLADDTYDNLFSTSLSSTTSLTRSAYAGTSTSELQSQITGMRARGVMKSSTSSTFAAFGVSTATAVTKTGIFGGKTSNFSASVMAPFRSFVGTLVTNTDSDDEYDTYYENYYTTYSGSGSLCTMLTLYSGWFFTTASKTVSTTASRTTSMSTTVSSSTASATSQSTGTTACNVNA